MNSTARQIEEQATAEWQAQVDASRADTYVYRYYDTDGALLYVGSTKDLDKRDRQHKRMAKWYPRQARRTVRGPHKPQVALGLEQIAIREEAPLANRYAANGYAGPGSRLWHERVNELWQELPQSVRLDAMDEALSNAAAFLGLGSPEARSA